VARFVFRVQTDRGSSQGICQGVSPARRGGQSNRLIRRESNILVSELLAAENSLNIVDFAAVNDPKPNRVVGSNVDIGCVY